VSRLARISPEWRMAIGTGVAIGIVYVLSPLTVWFVIGMIAVTRWARHGLEGDERCWLTIVLTAAIVTRTAAVGALFAITDHTAIPFGSFFGDEEYFIKRSIWLRNTGLGLPVHGADLIYAFDEYSVTSYLYVLALLQVFVGRAPYGVHLLAIGFYVASTIVLYRLARRSFGSVPAFAGLLLLLFLPTLFAWSISALKDPLFSLLAACSLVAAVNVVRAPRWPGRIAAIVALAAIAGALATIRQAGGLIVVASALTGMVIALLAARPRLLIVAVVAVPIAAGLVLRRPEVQVKAYNAVVFAAGQHWGHVATPGWAYKVLDDRFYPDRGSLMDMRFDEAARFLFRSIERYVTVPLPWESRSMAALAYLPEQIVWYGIVAGALIGLPFAFRRDVLLTGLLVGYALVPAVLVALTSGNVGTLVRHRGLSLPFIVWLSATAGCELLARVRTRTRQEETGASGFVADPLWR